MSVFDHLVSSCSVHHFPKFAKSFSIQSPFMIVNKHPCEGKA
jgi:hypothetical protein